MAAALGQALRSSVFHGRRVTSGLKSTAMGWNCPRESVVFTSRVLVSSAEGASLRKAFKSSSSESVDRAEVNGSKSTKSARNSAKTSSASSQQDSPASQPQSTADSGATWTESSRRARASGKAEDAFDPPSKEPGAGAAASPSAHASSAQAVETEVAPALASVPTSAPLSMLDSRPSYMEYSPRITVVGCGGAGGNAVSNMIARNLEGVDFLVCNTDAQHLSTTLTDNRLQLGRNVTDGLGCGANPDVGRQAAMESKEEIRERIQGSHMVFITAGMGGGTGTGATPVIAETSIEAGILTVAVVTKPFRFEGAQRMRLAEEGLENLRKIVDTLIVIPNQNLFKLVDKQTSLSESFRLADDVLLAGVRSVTDLMVRPGLINLDFADVQAVIADMGNAMMGTGEATGEGRALRAAEDALSNPLMGELCIKAAKGVLVNITGGSDMTLFEVDEAATRITDELDDDTATIIVGSAHDATLDGTIRVSVVAAGLDSATGA